MFPTIRILGRADYEPTWREMHAFNAERDADTEDEIWLVEHPPVYTLGLAGDPSHVLNPGDIPVVKIDRGGQVTYHGPGQLVCYLMLDVRRLGYGVRELVRRMEESVIALLRGYGLEGHRELGMPGVYVDVVYRGNGDAAKGENAASVDNAASAAKISAIGLRVARHCTYHGLALNVNMDLEPFTRINPCGYPDLKATQLADLGVSDSMQRVGDRLVLQLNNHLYGKVIPAAIEVNSAPA